MKKPKRSDIKIITLQGKIIRYMRIARKISMREAGRLHGVSDTAICHYEHGRMGLSSDRAAEIAGSYGYSREEFEAYMKGTPLPAPSLRDECHALLSMLDEEKLKTAHAVLTTFALKTGDTGATAPNPYRYWRPSP